MSYFYQKNKEINMLFIAFKIENNKKVDVKSSKIIVSHSICDFAEELNKENIEFDGIDCIKNI